MRKISLLVAMALMVAMGSKANAQLERSLYLNLGVPTGDFSKDRVTPWDLYPMGKTYMGNNAVMGFGIGARISYFFDIGFGELAPFAGIDMLWNPIKKDLRKEYMDADNCKYPKYWNIPAMVGVTYRYSLDRIVKPYAEFGVGCDIFSVTAEGFHNVSGKQEYKYTPTTTVAWQIGAGTYLGDYVSVGINYYHLGLHVIDYRENSDRPLPALIGGAAEGTKYVQLGMTMFRIGFHF